MEKNYMNNGLGMEKDSSGILITTDNTGGYRFQDNQGIIAQPLPNDLIMPGGGLIGDPAHNVYVQNLLKRVEELESRIGFQEYEMNELKKKFDEYLKYEKRSTKMWDRDQGTNGAGK